ncbi:MAG: hypothetical protein ABI806_17215 [Candidatus Solibacter sp.]
MAVRQVTTNDTLASKTVSAVQLIDLSDKPAKAMVVRQGFEVPGIKTDQKRVDQIIGALVNVPTLDLPRVVSQGIPAGTKVTAGTVVDLILAPRKKIPFDIIDAVHMDLTGRDLTTMDTLFADQSAKKTLQTYENASDVPAAEKSHLILALGGVNVGVDDANPGKTFEKAFDAARGALAYQG